MFKNTASQKITLLAIDTAANVPKTGDAANITAYVQKDDGAVTVLTDTSAAELDATNAPGLYSFDVSQTESNADKLVFSAKSSTSGIRLVPVTIYTFPTGGVASPTNITAASGVTISGTLTTIDAVWTELKRWLRILVRADSSIAADYSDVLTSINANTGTGTGVYDNTASALHALHTHLADIENGTNDPLVSTSGTATAGGASTITLAVGTAGGTDYYVRQAVMLTGGTGAGQTNRITAYNSGTRVATVADAWVTQPDNTTTYKVLGRTE